MDLEKVFDMVCHMHDSPESAFTMKGKNNNDIILTPKQQKIVVRKSIQAFIHKTGVQSEHKSEHKIIQAFAGSSELPKLTKDVFNVTQKVPNFDLSWQQAFKGIPLKKGQLEWEICDVEDSIVYQLIPEGGKCKFFKISGASAQVGIQKYGAGLGITWETIEGRKLYKFIDQMEAARTKLYKLWADIHYGLLATAAALTVVTWQGTANDPVIDRDIATLNKGYLTIGEATKDSGYGDTANEEMLVFASPLLKSRFKRAIEAVSSDIIRGRRDNSPGSVGSQTVDYNITPYYTWNSAIPANKALMILPGKKIQNSIYLRELGLSKKDIESLNELRTYWTAFGGAVGDTDQTALLNFN
ncbi:MAG: hypothetical protein P8Y70_00065 [Candidatus Lokiarchaeota archaeon]